MKRIHRAWLVCLGGVLLMIACTGVTNNAFSVMLSYMISDCGITNSQGSWLNTIRSLAALLTMTFTAAYYKKLGLRKGVALCLLLCAAGTYADSLATGFAGYCIGAAITGAALSFGSMVSVSIAVDAWFETYRGTAAGLCSAGSGMASLILPPILAVIVEKYSVAAAFRFEAAFILALGLIVVFVCFRKETPEKAGMEPYRAAEKSKAALQPSPGHDLPRPWLALMLVAMFFCGVTGGPGANNLLVAYRQYGFSPSLVAAAGSIYGLALMAGKLSLGAIADRIGTFRTNFIFLSLMIAGFLLTAFASYGFAAVMFLAQVILPIGMCSNTVGLTLWAGELSDPDHHAVTMQHFMTAYFLGMLVYSPVPGIWADAAGSYVPGFLAFAVMAVLMLVIIQFTYLRCAPRENLFPRLKK